MRIKFVFFFLAILFALSGCNLFKEKPNAPVIYLTADKILSEYQNDCSSAINKYDSFVVKLSGIVTHYAHIRRSAGITVKSSDPKNKWQILCVIDIDDQSEEYSQISLGKEIDLTGEVESELAVQRITIKDCKID